MAGVIETLAEGLGTFLGVVFGSKAFLWVVFLFFTAVWIAFAYHLVASPERVDEAWQWVRGLPLIVQLAFWGLGLPVMLGLWIWETGLALWLRYVLVLGIGAWTVFILIPRSS